MKKTIDTPLQALYKAQDRIFVEILVPSGIPSPGRAAGLRRADEVLEDIITRYTTDDVTSTAKGAISALDMAQNAIALMAYRCEKALSTDEKEGIGAAVRIIINLIADYKTRRGGAA